MGWTARRLFIAAVIGLFCLPSNTVEAGDQTVVELFTSQGCSSCPAADRYLGELAERDGVIALAFHVDYWNYIGWHDPFSDPAWSHRQRVYGQRLGRTYVYTPQIVVDGMAETVGSRRSAVEALIEQSARREKLAVALSRMQPDMMRIIVAGRPSYNGEPATIWLVFFDREHVTSVGSGENQGRVLRDRNIVRQMIPIGTWQGEPVAVNLSLPALDAGKHDDCAVLVQEAGGGPILGASEIPLAAASNRSP
jgi:hypothetical protein